MSAKLWVAPFMLVVGALVPAPVQPPSPRAAAQGSAATTTLAALIEKINQERAEHIITIEDPIEYLFENKKSLIEQREVRVDTADFSTALHCAFGTMVALMARKATGKGQVVEGALLATAVTLSNALLIEQAVIKPDRVPTGNRGQTAAPVDLFRTRDGWILCQVIGKPLYKRWADLMGEPEWLTDPRFKDDISRGNNGAIISERMSRWCAGRTTAEVLEILGKAKIPAGPVLKPQQTLDDPQVNAMGFFQPTEFPGMQKPAPIAKAPVFLSDTPGSIRHRAPMLGEHTDEILAELGYGKEAIAALRQKAVI